MKKLISYILICLIDLKVFFLALMYLMLLLPINIMSNIGDFINTIIVYDCNLINKLSKWSKNAS